MKKLRWFLWMLLWCLLVPEIALANSLPRIRAAYVGGEVLEQRKELLTLLASHGFTTVLVADPHFPEHPTHWQEWARVAEECDLDLIAVFRLAVPSEFREIPGQYRPYVNRNGAIYPKTPCPTDEAYWNSVVGARFVRLAELTYDQGLGATFDAEMYGSEISWFSDLCYCDVCWHQFSKSAPVSLPAGTQAISPESRLTFLIQHNLLQAYTTFQWTQVRDILSATARQVHTINPDFRLGFLGYQHTWFFSALVHGLGTEEHPVLVFSESSYVRGYTPYVDIERDRVLGNSSIAEYIPGLWLERFAPETLPAQLVDLARHTHGYWLYTSGRFWTNAPENGQWRLNGHRDKYWLAFQQANRELHRLTILPDALSRRIPPVKQATFYDEAAQRLLRTPELLEDLVQAFERLEALKTGPTDAPGAPSPIIYRGETLFHCRLAKRDNAFQIRHVAVAKDIDPDLLRTQPDPHRPIAYRAFDPDGRLIDSGTVAPGDSPQTLTIPAEKDDLVSILLSSGTNGAQVEFSGLFCVVEASSTFPLSTFRTSRQYRLYVPPATKHLNIRAHAPRQQSALITLKLPTPQIVQQASIRWFTELHANNPVPQNASIWRIQIAPSSSAEFGDVRLYVYDSLFPYIHVSE